MEISGIYHQNKRISRRFPGIISNCSLMYGKALTFGVENGTTFNHNYHDYSYGMGH